MIPKHLVRNFSFTIFADWGILESKEKVQNEGKSLFKCSEEYSFKMTHNYIVFNKHLHDFSKRHLDCRDVFLIKLMTIHCIRD